MSYRSAPNDLDALLDPGEWTPNGSRIWVRATPPQNDAAAPNTPQNAFPAANTALTPMVIDDTLDLLAMAPFIHAAQNPDPALTQQAHTAAGNGTIPAVPQFIEVPPLNPAQAQSAFQQLNVPLFIRAGVLNAQNVDEDSEDAKVNELTVYLGDGMPLADPTRAFSAQSNTFELSDSGGSPVHAEAPDSSPISFDLDSPSPAGPRAAFERAGGLEGAAAMAASMPPDWARLSTPRARAVGATTVDASEARNLNDSATTPRQEAANGQQREADNASSGGATAACGEREGTIDYFAYFPTPPPLDIPQLAEEVQGFVDGTATAANATTNAHVTAIDNVFAGLGANAGAGSQTHHGEPPRDPLLLDNPPSLRKRLWEGSPNQEATRRALRRPRLTATTPNEHAQSRAATLQNEALGGSNPWRNECEGVEGGGEGAGRDLRDAFIPVAVSTPAPSVHNPSNRTPLGQRGASHRMTQLPNNEEAQFPERPVLRPQPGPLTAATIAAVPPTHAQAEMDVDTAPADWPATPSPEPPRRDKGKKRATSPEPEPVRTDDEPDEYEEAQWDEAQLLEARQRSLRHAMMNRPGQPSGAASGAAGSRLPLTRDARNLVRREAQNEYQRSERANHSSLLPPIQLTSHRGYEHPRAHEEQTRYRAFPPRESSAFHPLPNTRAAEYMESTDAGARFRTPPLTQRPRQPTTARSQPPAPAIRSTRRAGDRFPPQSPPRDEDAWMRSDDGLRLNDGSEDEERNSQEDEAAGWLEDGELIPSALRADNRPEDDVPMAPPRGGFPRTHRDDPETATRGMATEWIREVWADPVNSDVLVDVYNYCFTEDDEHNRRVADQLRLAFERITGEHDFDVVPPEPAEMSGRRARDRPTIWAIRGLAARSVAAAVARSIWSFRAITFLTYPRAVVLPSWIFMLEGFLNCNTDQISTAVRRVLTEEGMWNWIADMTSTNPDFAGMSPDVAVNEVLDSIRVDTFQLSNGNYVANVHIMRSPTRSMREWRLWVAALRARCFPSFTNGTGRVRYIAPCGGCRSVNHLTHLCPYPRLRGWNGPAPGEGVFHENRRDDEENDPSVAYGRWAPRRQRDRDDRWRNEQTREHRRAARSQGSGRGGMGSGSATETNTRSARARPPSDRRGNTEPRNRRHQGPGKGNGGGNNRRY
ncbi:hypothetical protein OH76DRAFT_1414808 [Lentinus brumalis]|uniref:Uncharacterized protein n=1 Tax=Lentinus brumalis TaxID=2498619 RepID=A0A371DSF1_9APHY|nr:hypothetical protein OH76DRAFT_1414808 [Polyporus brumalis]